MTRWYSVWASVEADGRGLARARRRSRSQVKRTVKHGRQNRVPR